MNVRRRIHGLLLSAGLLISFITSIALLAWHEHGLIANDRLSFFPPNDVAEGGGGGGGAPPRSRGDHDGGWPPVLSAYAEPSHATDAWYDGGPSGGRPNAPLPPRRTSRRDLARVAFPRVNYTSALATSTSICGRVPSLLPVDDFADAVRDPYLPWLHDLFVGEDGTRVDVIAQNRRRCHKGIHHREEMRFWEGQVALFQPVAIRRLMAATVNSTSDRDRYGAGGGRVGDVVRYRLSSHGEADADGIETRFVCRFKTLDYERRTSTYAGETLSTYPFNYEFVNWRKQKASMVEDGKEQSHFWLSPLMFHCPIPAHLQQSTSDLTLDIVPIRTPARRNDRDGFFFHDGHGGPTTFDAEKMWGRDHVLPMAEDSGRWENLPVCSLPRPPPLSEPPDDADGAREQSADDAIPAARKKKPHRLVACTWTSALHQRRGNERRIADGKARLREWIAFNLLVGFDHLYVFDNTGANATIFRLKNEVDPDFGNDTSRVDDRGRPTDDDLSSVTDLFPPSRVTRIDWPATVCNNNRPAHDDPGERSSQYAAEAACRGRYGPYTDWMASLDPDEYFVPMGRYTNWKQVLDKVDGEEGRKVLKFRSTRARPLLSAMVPTFDEGVSECTREMAKTHNQCLAKSEDKSYLETYNCEYIKSPKPQRFARAMKQFYRPDFVLSHYVHYSTVTTDLATEKQHTIGAFVRQATDNPTMERFVDELEEGVLIHAKTTVPAETFSREKMCVLNAPSNCLVGIPCPDDVDFNDALHTKNVFRDENGKYCNCWKNRKVEEYWLPKLNDALSKIGIING